MNRSPQHPRPLIVPACQDGTGPTATGPAQALRRRGDRDPALAIIERATGGRYRADSSGAIGARVASRTPRLVRACDAAHLRGRLGAPRSAP